ncbi:MAG: pyruvate dehydrogenase (acetyl-transferring), homodimeric type, partial [Spirochaetia bacterium]|nr:pyruvate dehydrogenase (acetyl-transferring), homodimeric type [Spirochaetia bacterium]
KDWSDEQLEGLRRGGLDPRKVYAAYHRAENLKNGRPTVIIAKTIKGFGLGQSGESKNIAHQQKKMELEPLKALVKRYNLPLSEKDIEEYKFIRPEKGSPEMNYIEKIRERLGAFVPARTEQAPPLALPGQSFYEPFYKATAGKGISTTMAFVRILSGLLSQKEMGKHVVPIIPDEARTFGMEGLFRQYGIYSVKGQLYDPVDSDSLTPYRESKDGQIFQEGINEAGSLASFIAAGTAYSHQNVNLVPFYSYYSMFGFQRVGDLIWAACDMKCRGFLMGGTSGRTTLNGEGLQHEDGHSPILASTFPNVQVYDPAFLYEMAVVIKDGLERMYQKGEDLFYYITMYNENYEHPAMPEGVEEGIKKGLYRFSKSAANAKHKIQLISSGVTFKDARRAAEILEKDHGVSVDLWSAPSFKRLREETQIAERWNKLHPTSKPKTSYLQDTLAGEKGTFVAVTDYMRSLPEMIAPWVPGGLYTLGTDGFGMSSSREELRRYFEVDTENIVVGCLHALALKGEIKMEVVAKAIKDLGVDPEKKHGLHLTTGKEH